MNMPIHAAPREIAYICCTAGEGGRACLADFRRLLEDDAGHRICDIERDSHGNRHDAQNDGGGNSPADDPWPVACSESLACQGVKSAGCPDDEEPVRIHAI